MVEGAKYAAVMPCRILEIVSNDGEKIEKGQVLLVMESMKTEIRYVPLLSSLSRGRDRFFVEVLMGKVRFRLMAKSDGRVKMLVAEGDICSEGTTLCEIVEDE